jgi:hypothetical protein
VVTPRPALVVFDESARDGRVLVSQVSVMSGSDLRMISSNLAVADPVSTGT